jgi:biopolymer transport protein ExbB
MSSLSQHRHVPVWLILILFAVSMSALYHPIAATAQDDPSATASANGLSKPSDHAQPKSLLMWVVHTSGWIGAFLLVISIYFIATVMQLFLELRSSLISPPELIEQCESLLTKRDFNGVYKAAKGSPSELGQLIATGMAGLSTGLSDAREAIDRQGEVITVEMEKRISMLAVIGTLGPLIGLLGTLKGMISSFSVIATSDTQLKASEVAGGISEALILTFEGVFLSVPAIYFFAVFKNRVASLSVQTLNLADEFIRRLYASAQKKPTTEVAT